MANTEDYFGDLPDTPPSNLADRMRALARQLGIDGPDVDKLIPMERCMDCMDLIPAHAPHLCEFRDTWHVGYDPVGEAERLLEGQ